MSLNSKQKYAEGIFTQLKKVVPNPKMELNYSNSWELLVSVILSAQCTDKQVNKVTGKLFKKYRTLDDYVHAKPLEFEKDIYSTGFYRNKTKNILASAKLVKGRFGGKIPNTMKEILELPGVSRKTANVVLGNAYGVIEGIAVDTHVIRLSQELGLTKESTPEKIERDLMQLLPKKEWFKFTYYMIEYGRKYCPAKKHKHNECPVVTVDK